MPNTTTRPNSAWSRDPRLQPADRRDLHVSDRRSTVPDVRLPTAEVLGLVGIAATLRRIAGSTHDIDHHARLHESAQHLDALAHRANVV